MSGIPRTARNNLGGTTAYERERQQAAIYGKNEDYSTSDRGKTELDVLKENMRFIRDDEDPATVSWEERVARSYESKLFKEYALIDLKHYKSGRIALRWRTGDEVVSSIGEDTCGSLRCVYHNPTDLPPPRLTAFELPFAYEEGGERKSALVKVKLCKRCARKLMWKKDGGERDEMEKEKANSRIRSASPTRRTR